MNIIKTISEEAKLGEGQISATVALLDEGASVPFIARYRKEATGNMTDEQIRFTEKRLKQLRDLEEKKMKVHNNLEERNLLTPELIAAIDNAKTSAEVDDIYRPFIIKKESKVEKAMNANLDKLALFIRKARSEKDDLNKEAEKYICENYPTKEDCIKGACHLIAAEIGDNPNFRKNIKKKSVHTALLTATAKKDAPTDLYQVYNDFSQLLCKTPSFRLLAINRGVKEKCLTKKIVLNDESNIMEIEIFEVPKFAYYKDLLKSCVLDAYNRIIYPSVCTDLFNEYYDIAEDDSIEKFKKSLSQVLLEAPVKGKVIMGIDPGLRTGCKIAIISENGDVIGSGVSKITHRGTAYKEAVTDLVNLIKKYNVTLIALGNGTGGREAEDSLVSDVLPELENLGHHCDYAFVSESGASIYSASEVAIKEFPQYDVTIRGAISIARRLQDPLSELVKVPPESIGVGQYQHDLTQSKLKNALKGQVEDAVSSVGADINIASEYLLTYISGLSKTLAKNIVEYRSVHKNFQCRDELKNVKGFGAVVFKNCAGFLRIQGYEPLDNTGIHPESYDIARGVMKEFGINSLNECQEKLKSISDDKYKALSSKLNVGVETLKDIVKELISPRRDPRVAIRKPRLLKNVDSIEKLQEGMVLEGTVRNITDFGAFVDIGVHCEGLIHKSKIAHEFVKNVADYLQINQIVKVKVISVDVPHNNIKLSMLDVANLKLTADLNGEK